MESRRILKNQFNSRNINIKEDINVKIGRRNYFIDFYLKEYNIGIVTLDWKRTIPVNKILQLERIQRALDLKKIVLVCDSLSENAKEFLSTRDIPIDVVLSSQIEYKERVIDDFVSA